MKKLIIVLLACFLLSGCSLLKTVVAPLTPVVNTLPQEISKSKAKVVCKGKIEYDINGNILSCSKGYYNYGYSFNETERKLSFKEKVAQFITRSSGYLLLGIIFLVIFAPSMIGVIFGRVLEGVWGTGKALKDVVTGIAKGKKYIRSNGSKYTPEQREIYQQCLDDMMKEIENSQSASGKKIINSLRAKM